MATRDQFPNPPPLRFELTEEQAAELERTKPPSMAAMVVGYARRHPWPDPEKFTLCAWFVEMPEAEAALVAARIMAPGKRRRKDGAAKSVERLRRETRD